ncbi:MAG: M48 family metallopeptidase [Exilispira sp.]|jgi:predicted metal-dependent hydrolase|nr:M48 family metallopeptidase [Exilispira sp.]
MIKIDKIIKSRRKTISLCINDEGFIIVKAPLNVSKIYIDNFIKKHERWIIKKIDEVKKYRIENPKKNFIEGENFLFLGNFYRLKFSENQGQKIIFTDSFYINSKYKNNAKDILIHWYKNNAYKILSERADYYSKKFGYKYNKIKITSAKRRWGSCSFNGNLNFSYRILLLPVDVIDYVVIHEIVHLKVRDHSKRFWKEVQNIMPDYKKHHNYLKENRCLLSFNGF